MSRKKKTNTTNPTRSYKGASPHEFKHRWVTLLGGLQFITVWRHGEVLSVSSEADHYVQTVIGMKNAARKFDGPTELEDVGWVRKWSALREHFALDKSDDEGFNALPEEQRSYEAVLSALAFVRELEQRLVDGHSLTTPIQDVIDSRIAKYQMNEDDTRVVRKGGSDV